MPVMQVSRKVDYALRAMIYLSFQPDGHPCAVGQIAGDEGIPKKFLEKIIQDLIHRGLVRSTRGAQGGYALAKDPATVTFKDIIEAIEGPVSLNVCVGESGEQQSPCTLLPRCAMLSVWQEAQSRVMDLFASTTLADVRRRHGEVPRVVAGAAAG
jgi:Rrf2 family protein